MTGCLNGGSCLLDKIKETFVCSCKLPWSGQRCEVNSSEPLLSFRVFCFIIINSIFFHDKKKFLCPYFKLFNADFISYICYQAPGSTRSRRFRLYGLQCRICSWDGLNFSSFVLNRILELSRKCFTRTRKHLASDIFATREFMTPRQRGQRERQKDNRLNRQNNNSL